MGRLRNIRKWNDVTCDVPVTALHQKLAGNELFDIIEMVIG